MKTTREIEPAAKVAGRGTGLAAVTALAVSTLALTALTAMPASASGGDREVIRTGNCSGTADWKLKAKADDGRIEVEGEVDSNVNGQTWRWRIIHNGDVSAAGVATTHAPSGSFSVERRVVNAPGSDNIGWRARNINNGQVCRGSLSF